MNEQRIRELAEQASTHAEETVHYYMGQFDGLTWEAKILKARDQKFAELIVRECMNIAASSASDTNFVTGISQADKRALSIAMEIKQHFGVE